MLNISQVTADISALGAKFTLDVFLREQESACNTIYHALFILIIAEGENQMCEFMNESKPLALGSHCSVDCNVRSTIYSTTIAGEMTFFDLNRADDVALVLKNVCNVANRSVGGQFEYFSEMLSGSLKISCWYTLVLRNRGKCSFTKASNYAKETSKIAISIAQNQFLHSFGDTCILSESSMLNRKLTIADSQLR